MGWKLYATFVSPTHEVNFDDLLGRLELPPLTPIEDEPFEVALYPDEGQIYIGEHNNCLIITNYELTDACMTSEFSPLEEVLMAEFPDAEICTLVLHSVVNYFGYAVIKNGEKIRVRAGDSEYGVGIDEGSPLEEELPFLHSPRFKDDNSRRISRDGNNTYVDWDGEGIVFAIAGRYFGEPMDRNDALLFETNLKGFSYPVADPIKTAAANTASKPWWKFW
ncbi:hypothetical protein [Chitinophaga sp. Cy-1792]|uniref:DUF6928 family protein n=1 Tax=Chitinophaga sp. Cy-1792 TaxID=2608339 RepID=UPI00141DDA32|nr:hypothetical protein [Chitinophaga sp. Cy-1792]NIG54889.1 hypothetical protein [Chitinophaga sp. Cy-1792]